MLLIHNSLLDITMALVLSSSKAYNSSCAQLENILQNGTIGNHRLTAFMASCKHDANIANKDKDYKAMAHLQVFVKRVDRSISSDDDFHRSQLHDIVKLLTVFKEKKEDIAYSN